MNRGVSWRFNRKRLNEVLSVWKATAPDEVVRAQVDEALMDLIKDPLHWGTEDPEVQGVFHREIRTVTGARIGILYAIPNLEARGSQSRISVPRVEKPSNFRKGLGVIGQARRHGRGPGVGVAHGLVWPSEVVMHEVERDGDRGTARTPEPRAGTAEL